MRNIEESNMIKSATYHIPDVGMCHIDYCDEVVVGLRLTPEENSERSGENTKFSDALFQQILEYFAGVRMEFDITIDISNSTTFQQRVLKELQSIPYGERRTYKQIAEAIGNPKAARAVGGACNRNPIHLILPCHRVVGVNNALTGYAAGLDIKRHLLDLERNCTQC